MCFDYGEWWIPVPSKHTGEQINRECPNCKVKLYKTVEKRTFVCDNCEYKLKVSGDRRKPPKVDARNDK